jgi:hypothetical protein
MPLLPAGGLGMNGGISLVGRDRELSELEAVLRAGSPVLLLLAGETGIGKSSLLQAVRGTARSKGWRLVPHPEEALEVNEGFGPAALELALKHPVSVSGDRDKQQLIGPVPEEGDQGARGMVAAVHSLLAGTALEATVRRFTTIRSLVDRLRREAPLLLCLDVQTEDPDGLTWWSNEFWPAVAKSGVQVVMIAMTDLNGGGTLAEAADQIIRLGPLDTQAVRVHLMKVGGHLPSDELDKYADEISKDPGLLSSFSRLLPLTKRPADASGHQEGGPADA